MYRVNTKGRALLGVKKTRRVSPPCICAEIDAGGIRNYAGRVSIPTSYEEDQYSKQDKSTDEGEKR